MNKVYSTPILQSVGKAGLAKFWQGNIYEENGNYYTTSLTWQETKKSGLSVKTESEPYAVRPTNINKSNYKGPREQAYFDMESIVNKQRDKGYHADGEEKKNSRPLPMLAHKWVERKHSLKFPVYCQPKLDGNRMLYDVDSGVAWTRMGKDIIPEVIAHLRLEGFPRGYGLILDGELMLPGNVPLQNSMRAIKKVCPLNKELEYHVYDFVDTTKTFEKRFVKCDGLQFMPEWMCKKIKFVRTALVDNEICLARFHKDNVEAGYEGTMIRDPNGMYEVGQRSVSLCKMKDFADSEYKILSVKTGNGSFSDLAIFTCVTDGGKEFDCVPEGNEEYRRQLYIDKEKYIGKYLTIRYKGLSNDGCPMFPVGVAVREVGEF